MRIQTYNQEKEILVQTISLSHNNTNSTYLFRCFRCGSAIAQIAGNVTRIFPGAEIDDDVRILNKCPKCSERFIFKTLNYPTEYTRTTLSTTVAVNTFHCWLCRNPLAQFNEHIIALLPTYTKIQLPHKFSCFTPDCIAKYNLVDIV